MKKTWRDVPVFAAQQHAASDRLTITALRAWHVREPESGRRYTVVRLDGRGGHAGYGEGGPCRDADVNQARAAVVGIRAIQAELVRHRLAALPAMEAAVNNALLDVLGKALNTPVYQYLGGPTRFKVRVLAHVEGKDEEALAEPLKRAAGRGFRAFTVPVPGRDPMMWLMQAFVDATRRRVEQVRGMVGAESDVMLDGGGALTPGDAAFIATALEEAHPLWFDEPIGAVTTEGLAKVTAESVMPVGHGRTIHDIGAFQNWLRAGCIDVLRPAVGLNSIPKIRRMAAIAEAHYVAIAPFHGGGPVATAAALHLAASLPNFFIQQIPVPLSERDAAMRAELTSSDLESASEGFAPLQNKPGMGIQVNEEALHKYSEEAA